MPVSAAFVGSVALSAGVEEVRIMQKWLPTRPVLWLQGACIQDSCGLVSLASQEEVLPFHQWVKAWHVKVGRVFAATLVSCYRLRVAQ